jgi:DNA invertase Pin-like site-specific DNA recombinase
MMMISISGSRIKKAVAYYRHSAEDKQENSVSIQRDHTYRFADQHKVTIIHEEADEGKTGLLANRPGFERLFKDWIMNVNAPSFDYVLVYDVSRWGRFQDQDEAAYYEFLCKQQGKKVVYVSRGVFEEEPQLISHLQTSIERYMAAEYSRQLSDKVFHGSVRISEQGYSAGGMSCYGLARLLLDVTKQPVKTLKRGEWKSVSNERVTFTPANDETTQVVRDMFSLLVEKWQTPNEIAGLLNIRGVRSAGGGRWNVQKVLRVLTNEAYVGTRLYNKTWSRLRQKVRKNPRRDWIVRQGAFPAIVRDPLFVEAQERLYWLLPSHWRRGIRLTNKVKRLITQDIKAMWLDRAGREQDVKKTVAAAPLTFGVRFNRESLTHWCFVIEERLRSHSTVIAISIATDEIEPVDKMFCIPTADFGSYNVKAFSEADECYLSYQVHGDKIREALLSVLFPGVGS